MNPEFQTTSIEAAARLFSIRYEYQSGKFCTRFPILRLELLENNIVRFVLRDTWWRGAQRIAWRHRAKDDQYVRALRQLQKLERSCRQPSLPLWGAQQ